MSDVIHRVFLVGHHPGFRTALALTIHCQSEGTLEVVGEAPALAGNLAAIQAAQPDALVIVLAFESGGEHAAAQALRCQIPGCRVVVIETREYTVGWPEHPWDQADALLCGEELVTELVPTIRRLVA